MPATHNVTELLAQWANGDEQSLNDLTPIVYKELRQLAAAYLRKEQHNHTLQPTALVHEAYLRPVDQKTTEFSKPLSFLWCGGAVNGGVRHGPAHERTFWVEMAGH